ncbi:MAG TPA: PqqD family protein [Desulfuromonadaceae bacterium]
MQRHDKVVIRNSVVLGSEVEREYILMNPANGRYYWLDETATFIWGKMENPLTVGDLALALTGEYAVSMEDALKDTDLFLDEMDRAGLIEFRDDRQAGAGEPAPHVQSDAGERRPYSRPCLETGRLRDAANGFAGLPDGGHTIGGSPFVS